MSVVYAERNRQRLCEFSLQRGSSVRDALEASGLLEIVPALHDIGLEQLLVGIYAQPVSLEQLLDDGDRIEIYRPLRADPKEVRRQLALLGKTMGGKGKNPRHGA